MSFGEYFVSVVHCSDLVSVFVPTSGSAVAYYRTIYNSSYLTLDYLFSCSTGLPWHRDSSSYKLIYVLNFIAVFDFDSGI